MPFGMNLFHATRGRFDKIITPAWFTETEKQVQKWIPKGGFVIRFRTNHDIWLFDVPSRNDFLRLNRMITGGASYNGRYMLANMLKAACLPGWVGNEEVLITNNNTLEILI